MESPFLARFGQYLVSIALIAAITTVFYILRNALDNGADDYLTKPFGIEELLAQVRVALRHWVNLKGAQGAQSQVVKAGPLTIDLSWHIIKGGQDEIKLTSTEHLRVYMCQLRKKLEEDPERPQYILTEPDIGYRFIADE